MIYIHRTANILDLSKFNEEAQIANPAILIVLKFGDDDLRFTVNENWDAEDDTILDNFMASFQDQDPQDKVPLIYGLVRPHAKTKHFHGIKYTGTEDLITNLHRVETVSVRGEVQEVIWYKEVVFDGATFVPQTPVVKVSITYTRNTGKFALYRDTVRAWYNNDGTLNDYVKETRKYYVLNASDTMDEGFKRRDHLVQTIKAPVLEAMTQVLAPLGYAEEAIIFKGSDFLDDYEIEFNNFIKNSSRITNPADDNYGRKSIIVKFEAEDDANYLTWLDSAPPIFGGTMTIRQYLVDQFSI